ncbi:MAG: hypothetical protein AAF502_07950 [Bacteroidota bacterium]
MSQIAYFITLNHNYVEASEETKGFKNNFAFFPTNGNMTFINAKLDEFRECFEIAFDQENLEFENYLIEIQGNNEIDTINSFFSNINATNNSGENTIAKNVLKKYSLLKHSKFDLFLFPAWEQGINFDEYQNLLAEAIGKVKTYLNSRKPIFKLNCILHGADLYKRTQVFNSKDLIGYKNKFLKVFTEKVPGIQDKINHVLLFSHDKVSDSFYEWVFIPYFQIVANQTTNHAPDFLKYWMDIISADRIELKIQRSIASRNSKITFKDSVITWNQISNVIGF